MRSLWLLVLFVLSTGLLSGSICSAPPPSTAAFVDVTVVSTNKEELLLHQTVLVHGDRISEIGPADRVKLPAGCLVIDGRNRYLIPGLVDTHVHFFGYTRAGAGDLQVEKAILTLLLANGVTTALVMEGTPAILSLREEIDRGHVLGPKLYVAGPLIQMPNSGEPPERKTFTTPEEVRREVIGEKQAGYDFVKVHGDLPVETYNALLETARQQKIRVIGHVPTNLGIDAALNGGQVMIVHAESYLDSYFRFNRDVPTDAAEIGHMVNDVAARTAQAGTWVQPTLSVFRQIIFQIADIDASLERPEIHYMPQSATVDWQPGVNPYLRRWKVTDIPKLQAQYLLMQRLVRGLRDAGVPLLAGTDDMVPSQIPGFGMKDELEQLYEAGLTPLEALQTATSNPARFFGTTAETGTVAVGKVADLVLLDGNPVDDVENIFRQDGVMIRGHWFPEAELQLKLSRIASADNIAAER
jgi:imidazolonepropionase-like amidohydrolase